MASQRWERWSAEEWERACELLKTHSRRKVAVMVNRRIGALEEKIRWENMTEDDRQRRRDQLKARRRAAKADAAPRQRRKPVAPVIQIAPRPRVCQQALADREIRINSAPRDLTAAFFNDPLPGYSALDLREQPA